MTVEYARENIEHWEFVYKRSQFPANKSFALQMWNMFQEEYRNALAILSPTQQLCAVATEIAEKK